ncbi:hypothetical protein ELE36_19075 [Pseudolysobacter antarcticus]|uniref:DUF7684 domain-containing protein n=1 Tax=Pseudolysobacter antarcticus TaxID=2511995 RepID=A0A411HPB3_9GAMM|nr:hypothetical protein [Pseudolysobacter antarcticus]QBB72302.1 hypothetical protein ELE36_19075 [Pseudolysobacter antarcticus]
MIEEKVTPQWRIIASEWLVKSGCLYMLAWGDECSLWDDLVDIANLEEFGYSEIPDEAFVMTTWHESQTLEEVFRFTKGFAIHPHVELKRTLILHIAESDMQTAFLQMYNDA